MRCFLCIILIFPLLYSCKEDHFCFCYGWREDIIQSYDQSNSKQEKKLIENEMHEFDVLCSRFQEYTSSIKNDENLKDYFNKVEACE